MPYYLHAPKEPPELGTPYPDKREAVAHRTGNQTITFVADDAERETWTARERRRILDKTYTMLPWADADSYPISRYPELKNSSVGYGLPTPFYELDSKHYETYYQASRYHYAHISLKSDAMIAYTPSDEHGIADRQVRIRCGRYLDLVAPFLSQVDKDKLCALVRSMASASFKLARTPAEVRAVYRAGKGFASCMDGRNFPDDDESNPVSVYGNSDLAVAYLGCIDDDDPRVTARTVCWPDRKLFTRIYGDELIGCLLRADGWSHQDYLPDAKVRAIRVRRNSEHYVMPYIDAAESVDLSGAHFILRDDSDGEYSCRETNGSTGSNVSGCSECGNDFSDPDQDHSVCPSCRENSWACEHCDTTYYSDDNLTYVENFSGRSIPYCESCANDLGAQCAKCSETFYPCQFRIETRRQRAADDVSEYCGDCADDVIANRAEETDDTDTETEPEQIALPIPAPDIRPFRDIPIGANVRVITVPSHTGIKTTEGIHWGFCDGSPQCHCSPVSPLSGHTSYHPPSDKTYEVIA